MTALKFKNANGYFLRVSATKDQEEHGIEVQLPITRIKQTAECFLQWRDKKYGGAWGLNFITEKDIKKFLLLCSVPKTAETEKSSASSTSASLNSIENTSSVSGFVPPKIFISSENLINIKKKQQKPPIARKPIICKRSATPVNGSHEDLPSIDDSVPVGYDPIEYEFLTNNHFDDNGNNDELDFSIGLSASSKRTSTSSLYVPASCNDDSQSGISEDFQDSRPPSAIVYNRQIMTTRKASWLLVKNILIHSKKGKIDLASHRKWKKYWVALKGVEMLFYHTDEKTVTTADLDEPSHRLDVDCCIAQAVPEHTHLESVFSLSTKHGNAYYLQATSQTEVDNWIHCIHTSAAMAMARKKGMENVNVMLKLEIDSLNEALLSDERLKKMAELQLTVEKESQMKHNINKKISSWEHNLEFQHANIFRLNCYLAAMTSSTNPNPQDLLMHVTRSTRHALSKIRIFSVTSFYSYVNAQNAILPPAEVKPRSRTKLKSGSLKARFMNSLKISDDHVVSAIRSRHSPKLRRGRSSADNSDNESNSSSVSSKEQQKNQLQGRIGNQLYIQLPHNKTTALPYESNLKISDLIERICMKENLDSMDFFLMLMIDDNNHHGLLDYTIPKGKAFLDLFQFSSIKLCPKFVFEVTLTNPADYEHGAFGLELTKTFDERIIVTFVEEGSPARKLGILVEDEVVEVNGQNLREITSSFNDIVEVLNTSPAITLKVKSNRIDDPKKTLQMTDNMISFLVCPPPPKSAQPDLSDDILSTLIVPAPTDFDEDGESVVTAKSYDHNDNICEVKPEDIDHFLKQTEQVNIMTREMNAVATEKPPVPTKMKPGVKLGKAIIELLETEKTYVKNLNILLERYLIPLKEEDFLSRDEAELLVNNVREIRDFQQTFFEKLKEIVKSEQNFQNFAHASDFQNVLYSIGETFLEYVSKFKLYSTFCSCHSRAVKLLELNSNEALKAFLIARNPKQQHTGTLESYLITPIQRILRYPLLMKAMLTLMDSGSEEYTCLKNALVSVEKVADYINEMQRISETYTPVFQEMVKEFTNIEPSDMGVDNLLHYGRVQWVNSLEGMSKNSFESARQDDPENLTIFIFKKAVVLISYDSKLQKKMSPSNSVNINSNIKFHVMIPISKLLLRDHAWSENDTNQVWEIVDTCEGEEELHTTYMFMNRTGEEKKVFVNAIKESKKLNKISNSFPLLGDKQPLRMKQNRSTTESHRLSASVKSEVMKKKTSFSKKEKTSKQTAGLQSPTLRRFSHKLLGKS